MQIGSLLTDVYGSRKRWGEYFKDLLNMEDERESRILGMGGMVRMLRCHELNESPITSDEVQMAIRT